MLRKNRDTDIGGHQGFDRLVAIQFRAITQGSPDLPQPRFNKPARARRWFPADECLFHQFIDADVCFTRKRVLTARDHHQLIRAQIVHNKAIRDRLRYHDAQIAAPFYHGQLDVR